MGGMGAVGRGRSVDLKCLSSHSPPRPTRSTWVSATRLPTTRPVATTHHPHHRGGYPSPGPCPYPSTGAARTPASAARLRYPPPGLPPHPPPPRAPSTRRHLAPPTTQDRWKTPARTGTAHPGNVVDRCERLLDGVTPLEAIGERQLDAVQYAARQRGHV